MNKSKSGGFFNVELLFKVSVFDLTFAGNQAIAGF